VLTATKTVATAVEAMKRGAVDYITKPFEVEALRIKVRQLLERRDLEREVIRLRAEVDGQERLGGLVGASPLMRELFQTIRRVAASRATVLIQGESGTGKELVARAIHDLGDRADQPFVAVALLPTPASAASGSSNTQLAEPFSSTKSVNSGSPSKRSCCALCRRSRSNAWGGR
jgi:DNA-binding NtrC family response regulator